MRIEQEARYVGDDRWEWSVWVEGTEAELDDIDEVEYTLHATFRQPVRIVTNKSEKFRIASAGWGEFEINAHARMKDGTVQHLKHWLTLEEPDGGQAPAKEAPHSPRKVFVSYAAADAAWGNAIRRELSERGFQAMTADDVLEVGSSWQASMPSAIDDADLVVGIFSDAMSPWVAKEVSEAAANNVDVVPIAVGGEAYVPDWLRQTEIINVSQPSDIELAVDSLVERSQEI
jgi:prokaryotic YEATS domain/TIR domain